MNNDASIQDPTIDQLCKKIELIKKRSQDAETYINALGEGAQKVSLSIDGATYEINAILKNLFLCSQHDLKEYELIFPQLAEHVQNLLHIAEVKFGRIKISPQAAR